MIDLLESNKGIAEYLTIAMNNTDIDTNKFIEFEYIYGTSFNTKLNRDIFIRLLDYLKENGEQYNTSSTVLDSSLCWK